MYVWFLTREAALIQRDGFHRIHPHTPRAIFVEHGRQELGGGLELWRGYAQYVHLVIHWLDDSSPKRSVRPVAKTLLVNLDVTATAM